MAVNSKCVYMRVCVFCGKENNNNSEKEHRIKTMWNWIFGRLLLGLWLSLDDSVELFSPFFRIFLFKI